MRAFEHRYAVCKCISCTFETGARVSERLEAGLRLTIRSIAHYYSEVRLPKKFEATQVEAAKEHLRNLPTRDTPRNLTLEHTIRSLRADIDEALKRGNSVEDIVDALKGSSIDIGVTTLKNYLRRGARKSLKRPRRIPASSAPPVG